MILDVEKIHKQYASVLAVNELSFQVQESEIFALLGPNGAGKTSTVRMLIGLTSPDRGHVRYHSRKGEMPMITPAELGYLPEERGLYQDQKIIDVLIYLAQLRGMTRRDAKAEAEKWLKRFALEDRQQEKVSTLSKGNQQKVQLIASLLHKPRMLVLDEPFSGLDPINQEMVLELMRELKREGTTILLSAHQMALIERLADRILLMSKGSRVQLGDMKALRESSGLSLAVTVEYQNEVPALDNLRDAGVLEVRQESDSARKLILSHQADLNRLLSHLGESGPLKHIHSEAISLHDIYLRAVGHQPATEVQKEASSEGVAE